jgi:hypothetical protein
MVGRHKKTEAEAKSYMLRIRITEDERALLEAAAKSSPCLTGMPMVFDASPCFSRPGRAVYENP